MWTSLVLPSVGGGFLFLFLGRFLLDSPGSRPTHLWTRSGFFNMASSATGDLEEQVSGSPAGFSRGVKLYLPVSVWLSLVWVAKAKRWRSVFVSSKFPTVFSSSGGSNYRKWAVYFDANSAILSVPEGCLFSLGYVKTHLIYKYMAYLVNYISSDSHVQHFILWNVKCFCVF